MAGWRYNSVGGCVSCGCDAPGGSISICGCTNAPAALVLTSTDFFNVSTTATYTYSATRPTYSPPLSGGYAGPAYYPSAAGGNASVGYGISYILCLTNPGGFVLQAQNFNTSGAAIATTSPNKWVWTIGSGSSCSPFLLSGGSAGNAGTANLTKSMTATGA